MSSLPLYVAADKNEQHFGDAAWEEARRGQNRTAIGHADASAYLAARRVAPASLYPASIHRQNCLVSIVVLGTCPLCRLVCGTA